MSNQRWRPVRDGESVGTNLFVDASPDGIGWLLRFGKHGPHVWIPDTVQLCVPVEDETAEAVPVDDIERLLRAAEPVLHPTRYGRLLLRRVQRWLDTIRAVPHGTAFGRESELNDAPPPSQV